MSANLFDLDARNLELNERLASLPEVAETFHSRFDMSWIAHENALEGVVLSPAELVQAFEHQVVGDASLMSVVTMIRCHREALELVRSKASGKRFRLTLPFLEEIHGILAKGDARDASRKQGIYRREMPIHRTYSHDFARPEAIEEELEKVLKTLGSVEFREYDPVRQAAQAHWLLMQVYPFADHNGRVVRLVQNFFLLRAGYPPAIIHQVDRQRYHDALRQPSSVLRRLLQEALENTLRSSMRWVESLTDGDGRARAG